MFSGELPDLRGAWIRQRLDILLGTMIGIGATIVFISARLTVFFLLAVLVAWVPSRWTAIDIRQTLGKISGVTIALGALTLYALASSLWSADLGAAVGKVGQLFAVTLASLAMVRIISREARPRVVLPSEGLWLGFLMGVSFYLGECLTDQGIKIWLINALGVSAEVLQPAKQYKWEAGELVSIGTDSFTRNATPITLLLWPAFLAALGAIARPWNVRIATLIVLVAILAVLLSPHESSKLAILAGLGVLAVAGFSARWGYRVVLTLWVASCLAVVPGALLAHRLQLHKAPWVQLSARHRLVIWNTTAEQVLKAPVFGMGAYTTYVAGLKILPHAKAPDDEFAPTLSRHSHNAFLQIWLELGAVGALLLVAAGWQIAGCIRRIDPAIRPFALAAFSSAAALMATSYGIWQIWFMALLGLAPILFALGARTYETSRTPVQNRIRCI